MVLGHATVTAAGHRLLGSRFPRLGGLSLALLLVGAYLPDAVDKGLSLLIGLSGRGYAHSLVVQVVALGGLAWLAPRWRRIVVTVWVGATAHLVEDWVGVQVLLAPLLGLIPPGDWNALESIVDFYTGTGPLLWIELVAFGYWLAVAARSLSQRQPQARPSSSAAVSAYTAAQRTSASTSTYSSGPWETPSNPGP